RRLLLMPSHAPCPTRPIRRPNPPAPPPPALGKRRRRPGDLGRNGWAEPGPAEDERHRHELAGPTPAGGARDRGSGGEPVPRLTAGRPQPSATRSRAEVPA